MAVRRGNGLWRQEGSLGMDIRCRGGGVVVGRNQLHNVAASDREPEEVIMLLTVNPD